MFLLFFVVSLFCVTGKVYNIIGHPNFVFWFCHFSGPISFLLHPQNTAARSSWRQEIFDLGGIPNVIAAMTKFRRDADVQVAGAMV